MVKPLISGTASPTKSCTPPSPGQQASLAKVLISGFMVRIMNSFTIQKFSIYIQMCLLDSTIVTVLKICNSTACMKTCHNDHSINCNANSGNYFIGNIDHRSGNVLDVSLLLLIKENIEKTTINLTNMYIWVNLTRTGFACSERLVIGSAYGVANLEHGVSKSKFLNISTYFWPTICKAVQSKRQIKC